MVRYLGCERKSGEYEGRAYDNYFPHFLTDEKSGSWVEGQLTFQAKVKAGLWQQVVDPGLKPGMVCAVEYNRYGQVMSISVVPEK